VESGKWKVESGKWKVEMPKHLRKTNSPFEGGLRGM